MIRGGDICPLCSYPLRRLETERLSNDASARSVCSIPETTQRCLPDEHVQDGGVATTLPGPESAAAQLKTPEPAATLDDLVEVSLFDDEDRRIARNARLARRYHKRRLVQSSSEESRRSPSLQGRHGFRLGRSRSSPSGRRGERQRGLSASRSGSSSVASGLVQRGRMLLGWGERPENAPKGHAPVQV